MIVPIDTDITITAVPQLSILDNMADFAVTMKMIELLLCYVIEVIIEYAASLLSSIASGE